MANEHTHIRVTYDHELRNRQPWRRAGFEFHEREPREFALGELTQEQIDALTGDRMLTVEHFTPALSGDVAATVAP